MTVPKNQLLFCLGMKEKETFDVDEIKEDMYQEFPESTSVKKLNITPLLNSLCELDPPLLIKEDVGRKYRFADTKYTLCIRAALYKNKDETIGILDLGDI